LWQIDILLTELNQKNMRTFFVGALLFVASLNYAQECEVYIPSSVGTTLEYKNYDGKGKLISQTSQKLVSVDNTAEGTLYKIHSEVKPEKGDPTAVDLVYKCVGDKFYFDMNSFVTEDLKKSMGESQVKMTIDDMNIPFGASPGTVLDDGKVTMEVISESPIKMNFIVSITDRKVLAKESVTTAAGTFDCIKIGQTVITDMGIMKVTIKSTDWYSRNLGLVKSESFSKSDKPMAKMELTAVK
jgi:hypothetical protein